MERGEEVSGPARPAPPHVLATVTVWRFSSEPRVVWGGTTECTRVLRLGTFDAGLGLGKNAWNVAWEEISNFVGDLLLLVD